MSYHQETIDDIVAVMMAEKFYRASKRGCEEDKGTKRIVTGYANRIKAAKEAMKVASNAVLYDGKMYFTRSREDGYETCLTGNVVAYRAALESIVKRIEAALEHPLDGMFLAGSLRHIKEFAKRTIEGVREEIQ